MTIIQVPQRPQRPCLWIIIHLCTQHTLLVVTLKSSHKNNLCSTSLYLPSTSHSEWRQWSSLLSILRPHLRSIRRSTRWSRILWRGLRLTWKSWEGRVKERTHWSMRAKRTRWASSKSHAIFQVSQIEATVFHVFMKEEQWLDFVYEIHGYTLEHNHTCRCLCMCARAHSFGS